MGLRIYASDAALLRAPRGERGRTIWWEGGRVYEQLICKIAFFPELCALNSNICIFIGLHKYMSVCVCAQVEARVRACVCVRVRAGGPAWRVRSGRLLRRRRRRRRRRRTDVAERAGSESRAGREAGAARYKVRGTEGLHRAQVD